MRATHLDTSEVTTVAGRGPNNCVAIDGPLNAAALTTTGSLLYHPDYGVFVSSTDCGYEIVNVDYTIRLIH